MATPSSASASDAPATGASPSRASSDAPAATGADDDGGGGTEVSAGAAPGGSTAEDDFREEDDGSGHASEPPAPAFPDTAKVPGSLVTIREASSIGLFKRKAVSTLTLGPGHYTLEDMSSDERVRIAGVPLADRHLEPGVFVQDGYGGLEGMVQLESLSTAEKSELFQFFDDKVNLDYRVLVPRGRPLDGDALDSEMNNLLVRREVASILTQFEPEGLARRVFGTVSLLRRVIQKLSRNQTLLEDTDAAVTDALAVQDSLDNLKRESQLKIQALERLVSMSAAEKEELVQNFRADTLQLIQEHKRDKQSLQRQVRDLQQQLAAAKSRQSFSPVGLMNFLGHGGNGNSELQLNWERLLELLIHFRDGVPVPSSWRTMITVMTPDDTRHTFPPFTQLPRSEDGDESKESDPPAGDEIDLTKDSSKSSGSSSSKKRSRPPAGPSSSKRRKKSRKAPEEVQERPDGWIAHSNEDCLSDKYPLSWTVEKARKSLADHPVAWEDLRLDVQMLIRTGVPFPTVIEWLNDDRSAHFGFQLDVLLSMLVRMMYWNALDDVHWTKYVPRRYFSMADAILANLVEQDVQPEFWGPMVEGESGVEEDPDPDALVEDKDDKSKDEDFHPDDDGNAEEEEEEEDIKTPPRSARRRLSSSSTPATPKSSKKSRRTKSARTALARKDYEDLTQSEKEVIESPDDENKSWLHYGVRVKRGDPMYGVSLQTFGFPDYAPNRWDIKILKSRSTTKFSEIQQLMADAPWSEMFSNRTQTFFFHKRDDLSDDTVEALGRWIKFVSRNVRSFWNAGHWLTLDGSADAPALVRQMQNDRSNHQASFRKRVLALQTELDPDIPDSLWMEPGIWAYPHKLCHWILMDPKHVNPDTSAPYTVQEQLKILDKREPGRAQWGHSKSDKERIAHLPPDVRAKLIPAGQRVKFSDLWAL